VKALLLALAFAVLGAAPVRAAEPSLDADGWCTRVAAALRAAAPLAGHATVHVVVPHEPDFDFEMDVLRGSDHDTTRTVFEMREKGDTHSVVSELVAAPGAPLVRWYWDIRQERWVSIRGVEPTDRWADTLFRHEDLWLADPAARRTGSVRWVEDGGRRYVELTSEPYLYYQRVVTRIDPETDLPVTVRFYDNTGAPIREEVFEAVEPVDGHPFPKRVRLRDLMGGGESVVQWDHLDFATPIPPDFFDLGVLNDRIVKGVDPIPLDEIEQGHAVARVPHSPARHPDAPGI
jgi:hypothetical protein